MSFFHRKNKLLQYQARVYLNKLLNNNRLMFGLEINQYNRLLALLTKLKLFLHSLKDWLHWF